MRLTAPQLDYLIQRLEESDKAISGRVPRDAVLAAQTDIFLRLGIKDRDRMEQGRAEMGEALASFKEDMVGLIARFQAGQVTTPEALAEWKAMTGKYYVDMFRAGAKSVGNPYFDELTTKDMAFINKARRFEQTFFKGFLDDMQNPDFHPVHPFLDRAEYYADSAKAQFYNGMVAGAGKEVEIDWVLGVAEHCDDCIMISSGSPYTWDTLPTTPQAGDTECLFNCKCHLEIKMAREQEGMFTGGPAAAGPETTKPSDTPGRYASVWDAQGEPMTGEILDAADDLYQEMYKARQMIYATDGDEKQDWITRRQNINRELVQRFEDMGYRVTPNVAVKDLIDVARDALNEAPEGVIKDTSQIMVGAEVIFVRANYATKGVVEMKGADVHIETADGGDYKYDHDTDILFLINNPGQNESLIEGGPGSGNFGHAGRPGLVGGSGPGGSDERDFTAVKERIAGIAKSDYADDAHDNMDPIIEQLAAKAGMSFDEYVKLGNADFKRQLSDAHVAIRCDAAVLDRVIDDGRFKNQFETHTSHGFLDEDYRRDAEYSLGYLGMTPAEERPIYGYITKDGNGTGTLEVYGRIRVVLGDSIKERTTFSDQDSLNSLVDRKNLIPSPVNNPSMYSSGVLDRLLDKHYNWDIKNVSDGGPDNGTNYVYWEAQIHGGVRLKDIDHVIIPDDLKGVGNVDAVTKKLDAAKIKWEYGHE